MSRPGEILVLNRRRGMARISDDHRDGGMIIDVTSKGEMPWRRFSPFFPHGGIPVPYFPGRTAASVEGIWQGLKRFENEDCVDPSYFDLDTMRDLKRTSRGRGRSGMPRGRVLGHQRGADSDVLLDYVSARRAIYLPSYRWVLTLRLHDEVKALRDTARTHTLVLVDYTTNGDVTATDRPLSHAALIRAYLLDRWPEEAEPGNK